MATTTDQETLETPERETPKPLLDLTRMADRATVKLRDGSLRELKNLGDFGAIEGQALRRDGMEFRELWNGRTELDDDQKDRLRMLVDRVFETILDAPKTVKERVKDGDRAQIVLGFTGESPEAQLEAMQTMLAALANQPISES